jgi:hypothetical protein
VLHSFHDVNGKVVAMYSDTFDSEKARLRALALIRKQNKAASRPSSGLFRRLFPQVASRQQMTPLQECLAVHIYCAAPHSAME